MVPLNYFALKKKIFRIIFLLMLLALCLFFFYCNNTKLVDARTQAFYISLKDVLQQKGFSSHLLVISTKRAAWHNDLQVRFSGAAKDSRHLTGDAIDFLVLDINGDGTANSKDVDIAFDMLDKEVIKDKGCIGTYKNESSFINRQMIHIDCRGYKARWAR
jgi:uncharacterized protein YcbK (DUF882 family)